MSNDAAQVTPQGLPPIAIRSKRIQQAVALQEPDRVPFMPSINSLYAYHYNMCTVQDWMTDPTCMIPVMQRYLTDYDPDMVWTPGNFPIPPMETLRSSQCRWPGEYWDLPADTTYQYVDNSFIGEDQYDEFLKDPTLFIMRNVLPKKYEALGGLALINPYALTGHCILNCMPFGLPPVQESLQAMLKAGSEIMEYMDKSIALEMSVIEAGYPTWGSAVLCCPFDDFADNVRGLMELCMDVVTDPDLVDEALERWGDVTIPAGIANAKAAHQQHLFIPLHCGVDNFMSVEDYEEHYWPTLERTINAAIEADLTPIVFCEGKYHTRLDIIKNVERGKVIYAFEDVDWPEAKRKLGDVACIAGGMQTKTLMYGTPHDVEEEVKRSIDLLAPGGGFIMSNTVALDFVSPENMHAWREATENYGAY